MDVIFKEFNQGLDHGYRDFALLGTDIGDYGKDLGIDLLDLLEKLVTHKEQFTLRLRNVNPRWLIPSVSHFCELLKFGKIKYILTPVESGSNRILRIMNRGYNVEDYLKAVRKIRIAYPSILIKTQLMVGFPGETDDDFRKSMQLLRTFLFDYLEVYAYTKRPGTKAGYLLEEVDDMIITSRYRKLLYRSFLLLPLKRWLAKSRQKLTRPRQDYPSLA